jgi:hypothetical protein
MESHTGRVAIRPCREKKNVEDVSKPQCGSMDRE